MRELFDLMTMVPLISNILVVNELWKEEYFLLERFRYFLATYAVYQEDRFKQN